MKVLQTANLGAGLGGISGSIRYALYDTKGTETVAATNTGVYELTFLPERRVGGLVYKYR